MIPHVRSLAEVGLLHFALGAIGVYTLLLNARGASVMLVLTGWDFRRRREAKDGRSGPGDCWAAWHSARPERVFSIHNPGSSAPAARCQGLHSAGWVGLRRDAKGRQFSCGVMRRGHNWKA